jgi:hypothetical protein
MSMNTNAFARARAMAAAISAMMAAGMSGFELKQGIFGLGPYVSRGKGGKVARRPTGIAAARRAALKKRNRAKHRAACKGGR